MTYKWNLTNKGHENRNEAEVNTSKQIPRERVNSLELPNKNPPT